MGTCQYLLTGVRQNAGTTSTPWFSVEVQHRQAWNSEVSMTEHVWLQFGSYTIYMFIADPPQGHGMPSKIGSSITDGTGSGVKCKV